MTQQHGVALPLALMLLLLLALLWGEGLRGAAGESTLAANHMFRRAAFDAAEGGLLTGLQRLAAQAPATTPAAMTRASAGSDVDRSETTFVYRGTAAPVPGYSADVFVPQVYEIHSTGHSARDARVTLVLGVLRVDPR